MGYEVQKFEDGLGIVRSAQNEWFEKLAEIPSSSDLYDYRLDGNSHLPLCRP